MNAIVPLNVVALRVNANDQTTIASQFKGAIGAFKKMPWTGDPKAKPTANTGDHIVQPLEADDGPQNPFRAGIHLHAELPDYFRRGVQPPEFGAEIKFPRAPNRFLVIRYLSMFNAGKYAPATAKCWIVESDYVTPTPAKDPDGILRPMVSVPLPSNPAMDVQPYSFMGRVLDYATWNPNTEPPSDFLPSYTGTDGKALYLTSVGFVGPIFSSYYPECISVFGFWDTFADQPDLYKQIATNAPLQFKASYQVIGWIQDPSWDPLLNIGAQVKTKYNDYVAKCAQQNVAVTKTPADFFGSITEETFRWSFHTADIPFTLNPDKTLASITTPTGTICAGISQEIVWNMLQDPSLRFLYTGNSASPAVWQDKVQLAIGNTTIEALSALLKEDVGDHSTDPNVLKNYEYLLDALQLNMLHGLEDEPNKLITLDEQLHSRAFSQITGGSLWIIEQTQQDSNEVLDPDAEITLPLAVAEQLYLLNAAQKKYDQGRAALEAMRRQLFMDWFRYIKIYVGETKDPFVDINKISPFLFSNGPCELSTVIDQGKVVGILLYEQDDNGQVIGLKQPASATSLAGLVFEQFRAVSESLPDTWQLANAPAPPFYQPTDTVLLMESNMLEPVRRNGAGPKVAVRLSTELLESLTVGFGGATFPVAAASLTGIPKITSVTRMQADIQSVVNEAGILIPSLASLVADALKAKGGANNPAVSDYANFILALQSGEGGLSPLAGGPGAGLYAAVRQPPYITAPNPVQNVAIPIQVSFTFTNSSAIGWPPDAVGWTAQTKMPKEFGLTRVDPFMPVSLIWGFNFFPLVRNNNSTNYTANNLTGYFQLDTNAVDYQYLMPGGVPVPFTAPNYVSYSSSVVLSKQPVFSLTNQIDKYLKNFPGDPAEDKLKKVRDIYAGRSILAQALSGFNVEQILGAYIPKIAVQDLLYSSAEDRVTAKISAAARATTNDNWYGFGFSNQAPIATGPLAQANFGPLRSGFVTIQSLTIVDVFGQVMTLNTGGGTPSLTTIAAVSLQPLPGDTIHKSMIYLPPRVLPPSRFWFRWLSATYTNQVGDISSDFVEMNSHPATSPICGWVLPNHLDNSLFFYDADGVPIGSFGIEHGDKVYRTRAGNLLNPSSDLALDIGEKGSPTVNPSLATFLWYIYYETAQFLIDLMNTILDSDKFINPANYAQDATLAVLIGRPLALTRAVLGLETLGAVLPVSQADTSPTAPFPADVAAGRFQYPARQVTSTASLSDVLFPIRMGNLTDLDDGLVGYLIEASGEDPYSIFYSPAAPSDGSHDVVQPIPTTIQLTLNQAPIVLTMLVDPRAGVHATAGILPVCELGIPPDQYLKTMQNLAMTFFTTPVLQPQTGLVVPLPQESGFDWEWIFPGPVAPLPLKADAANETASYGYSPQTLLEGWLKLTPAPVAPSVKEDEE
jgi:hypothetical protein